MEWLVMNQYLIDDKSSSRLDPNQRTRNDWAPLHLACSQGHIEVVKVLVVAGKTDLNACLGERGTPLHCACREGKAEIVSYLLNQKVNYE